MGLQKMDSLEKSELIPYSGNIGLEDDTALGGTQPGKSRSDS